MILYNKLFDLTLSDYGIEIPIEDDRAKKTYLAVLDKFGKSYFTKPKFDLPSLRDLELAHTKEFVQKISNEQISDLLKTGFELVDEDGKYNRYNPQKAKKDLSELASTLLLHSGACIQASKIALQEGFSYVLGGGGHHAMSFRPSGFCLVNDIVISARKMQQLNLAKKIWVIDVDAHKGDGTAEITFGDDSIRTLSIHMEKGWPLHKSEFDKDGKQYHSYIPSDVDIPIAMGNEENYLVLLKEGIGKLKDISDRLPDLALVVHGSDPYEHDELQSSNLLNLTKEKLMERDKFIFEYLKDKRIPQTYFMAGGYGKRSWEIHTQFLLWVLSHFK